MSTTRGRVVIAGAGIGGLALARALWLRDITSIVVDRLPGPPESGLALNLPGNGIRALGAVGLGDDLARLGEPIRRREYRNSADRLLFAVDEEAFWGDLPQSRAVRHRDLLSLLGDGLPIGTVRWDRAVASVRSTPEGAEVTLADGTVEECALVVGADGVRSTVRSAVFGDAAPRSSVLSAASWRFMMPNPGVRRWVVWSDKRGAFLMIPIGKGEVYGFASATRGGPVDGDPEWLRDTFADFPHPVPEAVKTLLHDPSSLYHSPVEEVRLPRWSDGRAVLIGDAAHATGPVWAQGAAMAVEDAVVLADLLAERDDWRDVGAEYEKRRRPRVTHVQAMTDRFSKTAGMPGWIRDLIVPFVGPRSYRATYGPLKDAP